MNDPGGQSVGSLAPTEAAEFMERFQCLTTEEAQKATSNPAERAAMARVGRC